MNVQISDWRERQGKDGLILFPVWGVIIGDHGEEHPHRHLVVAPVQALSCNQPSNRRLKDMVDSKITLPMKQTITITNFSFFYNNVFRSLDHHFPKLKYASNQILVLHFVPTIFKFISYLTQRFFEEFREALHVAK